MSVFSGSLLALAIASITTALIVWIRYLIVSGFFAYCTKVQAPGLYRGLERQIGREIYWSTLSAMIYGIPAGAMLWLWAAHGGTAIYNAPADYPLWWLPLSVVVYLALHDTWFYWTHRLMHVPRVYRACHYVHHQSHPPTAWAAMSFHPTEALSGAILIPALALFIPIHIGALAVVMLVMTIFGVTNHLGWEIWPEKLVHGPLGKVIITATHHDQHHRRNRGNYGLYFRFWDRLCGTDFGFSTFGVRRDSPAGHLAERSGCNGTGTC